MKKTLLIPITFFVASAPIISLTGCNNPAEPVDPTIEPTGISISETSIDLTIGTSIKLSATVEPAEASQEVEWSSSDTAVCTVNNGEVEAIAEGKATITVKPKGYDIPAVCVVNVAPKSIKYSFEFTGINCKINNHDHFIIDIEKDAKVEYTVLPDDGFKLSADQPGLPEGATLEDNLLTIEKMDKPYIVTINAEPNVPTLVIDGLQKTYDGTIADEGHTDVITVNWVYDEEIVDVTDLVTFDVSGPLTWDGGNKWFSWSNKLSVKSYDCTISAIYANEIVSKTYSLQLNIATRSGVKLFCDGLPGLIQIHPHETREFPVTFWFCNSGASDLENVTTSVRADEISEGFMSWDASNGKFYLSDFEPTEPDYQVYAIMLYEYSEWGEQAEFYITFTIQIMEENTF